MPVVGLPSAVKIVAPATAVDGCSGSVISFSVACLSGKSLGRPASRSSNACAKTLISYELAAAVSNLNRDSKTALQGLNGRVGDVYQTGNLALEFAGFEQKNQGMTAFDTWELSHRLGTEISGFLGLPVLDLFTLTIDYRDGLVNFQRTR